MAKYTLAPLPYSYDALEPYIDAQTMQIHHDKHHQAYLDKFNTMLEKYPQITFENPDDVLKNIKNLPVDETDRASLKNNGGGFVNHNLFWQIMGPQKTPDAKLIEEITREFGSVDTFKKLFTDVSVKHFGSGWTWLTRDANNKLKVYSLPNQDSPLSLNETPIITLDLWEHAYYLKYQNRRPEYIDNFWNALKLI
ncbi:MAG: Superoxide dismutase, superoxide dismutase, Fe-Mn family [Candidatus Peregrinibacteria bacterium GW2011_GWF2_38_29]|nr:MAG: Superoxide dismutase, superoxide dismutase, Fe-Mn family [Candidatus Peregrinibacteria bacterium GW2011_GWF2_38_29]HBB03075.1 superoxide dismutase [Candidatus Peregrinibacteria bacterium]